MPMPMLRQNQKLSGKLRLMLRKRQMQVQMRKRRMLSKHSY